MSELAIPFTSKNYPKEKKKGIIFEAEGIGLMALGGIEIFFTAFNPILGLAAIVFGGLLFNRGFNLFRGKK